MANERPTDFVRRRGLQLRVGGDRYVVDGCNTYYLMVYAADEDLRPHVDEVLDAAQALGLNVVRTWGFAEGPEEWNALRPWPGEWNDHVLRGFDYVVREAAERGLRLIVPLVNYWPDYGGMDQYVDWRPSLRRRESFYSDVGCRAMYREHVERLLGRENHWTGRRYCEEPAILAWELANEPRAPSDPSGMRLYRWIETMAEYVKSLDDNHLVTVGLEGFHGRWTERTNPPRWLDGQGTDFVWHHEPEAVDIATFHLYPDHWWMPEADGVPWIRQHVRLAREELEKPVLLEEFGKRGDAATRRRCLRAWYDELAQWIGPEQPLAGGLFWALYHSSYPDYDGFGVYPGDATSGWRRPLQPGQTR